LSQNHQEKITLVVRDNRDPGWYWLNNEIMDDYRPLIGCTGLDLYNLYTRRSMNDTQKAAIPREVVRKHLSISPSTLTDHNYILEWCELIYIKRKHHRVHGIYMLDPQPITPEQLEKIRQNVYATTGGVRPRKPKNAHLRATILKRLENWQSLNDLWNEHLDAKQAITIIKASELQQELPGFESGNGSVPPAEYDNLIEEIVATFANSNDEETVRQEADKLLKAHGADIVARQLARWPQRAAVAKASDRGLENPLGLFVWSVKNDAPQWEERKKEEKEKSWYTEEEAELFVR